MINNQCPLPWRKLQSHQGESHYKHHSCFSLLKNPTAKHSDCHRKVCRSISVVYWAWVFSHDTTKPTSVVWDSRKTSRLQITQSEFQSSSSISYYLCDLKKLTSLLITFQGLPMVLENDGLTHQAYQNESQTSLSTLSPPIPRNRYYSLFLVFFLCKFMLLCLCSCCFYYLSASYCPLFLRNSIYLWRLISKIISIKPSLISQLEVILYSTMWMWMWMVVIAFILEIYLFLSLLHISCGTQYWILRIY